MKWLGLLCIPDSMNLCESNEINWPPGPIKENSESENLSISEDLEIKLKDFEEQINYKFTNKHLQLTVTKNYHQRQLKFSFNKLCLLGDSIMEFFVVRNLYEEKELNPLELHERKVAMLNKNFRGCLAIKLNLHKFMDDDNIAEYVSSFEEKKSFIFFKVSFAVS